MPDLCLIGHHAVGTSYSTAQYAVASGRRRLVPLVEKEVIKRGVAVVCNHPSKLIEDAPELVELLSHETTIWGRESWPNLAAGPLSVWAMAALGYETIYLYGLDGTADNRNPQDDEMESLRRYRRMAHVWEGQIQQVARVRRLPDAEAHQQPQIPKFVRIWPWSCPWRTAEPLSIVTETLRVPDEKRTRSTVESVES